MNNGVIVEIAYQSEKREYMIDVIGKPDG